MANREIINVILSNRKSILIFWLFLTLTFAASYGLLSLSYAFSNDYLIQDDARQHVFWMQRFVDPELFPDDIIADFFQSVAPWGYTNFYRFFALLGISPLFLSKILPVCLGLIIAGYFFLMTMEIFPVPAAAFISTTVFNQYLWKFDDLASATPRAFGMVLLVIFIYYLLRYNNQNIGPVQAKLILPCMISIGLIGLFYPQYIFISSGLIVWKLLKVKNKQDYWLIGLSLTVVIIVMCPYILQVSNFGPTINAREAQVLPEFYTDGRADFFDSNLIKFLLFNGRSGIFSRTITPPTMAIGLLLPIFFLIPSKFNLIKKITGNIVVLPQILSLSLLLFTIAHIFLFKLHLPSRYTIYTFQLVLSIATGSVTVLICNELFNIGNNLTLFQPFFKRILLVIASLFITALIFYPIFWKHFPYGNYILAKQPELYNFLARQPKNIKIASLGAETDNIGSFAKRSVLFSWEHAIPYQKGYYKQIKQRVNDLIYAQYSNDLKDLQKFIQKYKINFLLIDADAFTPEYLTRNKWLRQEKNLSQSLQNNLSPKQQPALAKLVNSVEFSKKCTVFANQDLLLLQGDCIK